MARKKSEADAGAKKINTAEERNTTTVSIYLNGENTDVKIKYNLSLKDALAFITDVYDACFDESSVSYMPESYEFAKRVCLIGYYTDIKMPKNTEEMYEFVYSEEVEAALEIVGFYYNKNQYADLINTIDAKINYHKDVITSAAYQQLNILINKINELTTENEKLFGGFDATKMSAFVESITKMGNVDEAKIAEAILKHQENTGEQQ